MITVGLLLCQAVSPFDCNLCQSSSGGCCQALWQGNSASCLLNGNNMTLSAAPNKLTLNETSGNSMVLTLPNQTAISPGWQDSLFLNATTDKWYFNELVTVHDSTLFCDSGRGCCILRDNATVCSLWFQQAAAIFRPAPALCPVSGWIIGVVTDDGFNVNLCAVPPPDALTLTAWQRWSFNSTSTWEQRNEVFHFHCH